MTSKNHSPRTSTSHQRNTFRLLTASGVLAGLTLALSGCFGGGTSVYQSVDSELSDGGWIIIDGDSVTIVDPDSDGVQQAITDIEESQINSNTDAYDVENGALNEAKDMVTLEGEDSASIEFSDDLIRLDGRVVFVKYDSELAEKDRGAFSPAGG